MPIAPFTSRFEYKTHACSRIQFPLVLAWAITVHKSQGLTLSRVCVGLGDTEFSIGLTYVAISRVKSRDDVAFFKSVPFDRLDSIGKQPSVARRLEEEERLDRMQLTSCPVGGLST